MPLLKVSIEFWKVKLLRRRVLQDTPKFKLNKYSSTSLPKIDTICSYFYIFLYSLSCLILCKCQAPCAFLKYYIIPVIKHRLIIYVTYYYCYILEFRKENAVFTEFLDLLHRLFELTQR